MDVQIYGASLDDIRELLGTSGDLRPGSAVPLTGGAVLDVQDVSKSSGFDATTVIVTAVIMLGQDVAKDLLKDWLKTQLATLFKKPRKVPVTLVVDGEEIQV